MLRWAEAWFQSWGVLWPPAEPRTAEELQQGAIEIIAHAEAHKLPIGRKPFVISKAEYITLLKERNVDFIYENGHVQRPTFMGLWVEVRP